MEQQWGSAKINLISVVSKSQRLYLFCVGEKIEKNEKWIETLSQGKWQKIKEKEGWFNKKNGGTSRGKGN